MIAGEFEPPYVLSLDIGTSSCRAVLYDARARRVPEAAGRVRYAPVLTPDGGAELNPDQLVQQVATAIEEAVAQAGPRRSPIAAVATSVFWHSLLGIDADGRPATPVYVWLDRRSRDAARALRRQVDAAAVQARTGCPIHATYWPARLIWLRTAQPALYRQITHWISFDEYLMRRFLGRATLSISTASGTGLLDQHRKDWDEPLLQALPVRREQLTPIAADDAFLTGLLPPYAQRWPALREAPWLAALGDGACSNVGAGCVRPERRALTIGTSAAIRALWKTEEFNIPPKLWGYRLDHQRIVLGGAFNDGGNLLGWLRKTFQLPPRDAEEAAIASVPPDGHGLTILPLWGGERSPGWADEATGTIAGLTLRTTPAEVLRAALEAIALRVREVAVLLRAAAPNECEVVASGGALLRSPSWLQVLADALDRPLLVPRDDESSSRGAAIMALDALGLLAGGPEATDIVVERTIEPVPANTAAYAAAAERQAALYERILGERTD